MLYLTRLKYKRSLITLGVLIFAGTNFRELSPLILAGTYFREWASQGTNFREFGTKIAKFAKIRTAKRFSVDVLFLTIVEKENFVGIEPGFNRRFGFTPISSAWKLEEKKSY